MSVKKISLNAANLAATINESAEERIVRLNLDRLMQQVTFHGLAPVGHNGLLMDRWSSLQSMGSPRAQFGVGAVGDKVCPVSDWACGTSNLIYLGMESNAKREKMSL